jgi:WD40 repeat protein
MPSARSFYNLVAGVRPDADTGSPDELIERRARGGPRRLRELAKELPGDLLAIVETAMAPAREARYPDAGALAADLRRFQASRAVSRETGAPNRVTVASAAVIAVVAAALGGIGVQGIRRDRDAAETASARAAAALAGEQRARGEADRDRARIHRELGRRRLDDGDRRGAAADLATSARLTGVIDPGLAYLLGRALGPDQPPRALAGPTAPTRRIVYLEDGAVAATASDDGSIALWRTDTGELVRRIAAAHAGAVRWIDASPDGARLASAGDDGIVRVWTTGRGAPAATLDGDAGPIVAVRFVAGGARLVTAGHDGRVRTWEAGGADGCATEPLATPLVGLEVSPNGAIVVGLGAGPVSAVWRTADCALVHWIHTEHIATTAAAFAPDGRGVVLAGRARARGAATWSIDLATGLSRAVPAEAAHTGAVAVSPDGARLAITAADGSVELRDAASLGRIAALAGPTTPAIAVAFDPRGELVITADAGGRLRVWDAATAALLTTHASTAATGAPVDWIRIRPDGRQLAVAGGDAAPRLYALPRWDGAIADLPAQVAP